MSASSSSLTTFKFECNYIEVSPQAPLTKYRWYDVLSRLSCRLSKSSPKMYLTTRSIRFATKCWVYTNT